MDMESIREAFFAWKRTEGRPEEIIPALHQEYYENLYDRSRSEDIMIDTWIHPGYSDWIKRTNMGYYGLLFGTYEKQGKRWFTSGNDMAFDDFMRRGLQISNVVTFGSYFQHLIPSLKTSSISAELALSGKYLESMILLRSALEGSIKAGLKAWKTIEDGDLYHAEKIDGGMKATWGLKIRPEIDELGLSSLCNEAEKTGLSGPFQDIYQELKLYEFNKFVHHNEEAGDEIGWHNLVRISNFDEENWSTFSRHHANLTELILIFTHNIARTQEWFDVKELGLDVMKISEVFPRFAEALIPDGLVENCITCKKPKPVKLTERRGRCKKCFDQMSSL